MSDTKFHVSKNGTPQKCNAVVGRCPLGGEHFDSIEKAQEYADNLNSKISELASQGFSEDLARTKIIQDEIYKNKVKNNDPYTPEEARQRGLYVEQMTSIALKNKQASHHQFRDDYYAWTSEREKLHEDILNELRSKYKDIPTNGKVIMSGGISGAGKTTVLTSYIDDVDVSEYATVSSDDIKEMLAERDAIPKIDGLTQMESSTLVHEESSYLANRLLYELSSENKNIIYDFTCKNYESAKGRIKSLLNSNYKSENIRMVFVDSPVDTSIERGKYRYLTGLNNYSGIGGRYLPLSISEKQRAQNPKHNSVNAESFLKLTRDKELNLTNKNIFDNSGNSPVEISYSNLAKGRNK